MGSTFTKGQKDAQEAVSKLIVPTFPLPADLPMGATKAEEKMWEKKIDMLALKEDIMTQNLASIYSIAWGQCTPTMQQKLNEMEDFDDLSNSQNH